VLAAPDLRAALLRAVGHSGDSDSTGAIAGNIAGALYGEAAIPPEWLDGLELRDVVEQVAEDLLEAFHGPGVGGEYEPIDDRLRASMARYPGY
jgi:ADP-ribosylglycohydrolase